MSPSSDNLPAVGAILSGPYWPDRAVTLWETGQREALARFLADNAHGREEQVRLVAQTLIDILPQDDKERRLLEGFLAGRDSVPDAPWQERLV